MKRLNIHQPAFNLAFGVYIMFKAWQFGRGETIPFLDAYLADFLALPVILSLTRDLLVYLKGDFFRLNRRMLVFAWLYTTLVFEVLAPRIWEHQYADMWDASAYGLGVLFYHYFIGRFTPD